MALQPDGKIVVAVKSINFLLMRFNADGSFDDGSPADTTPANLATTSFTPVRK